MRFRRRRCPYRFLSRSSCLRLSQSNTLTSTVFASRMLCSYSAFTSRLPHKWLAYLFATYDMKTPCPAIARAGPKHGQTPLPRELYVTLLLQLLVSCIYPPLTHPVHMIYTYCYQSLSVKALFAYNDTVPPVSPAPHSFAIVKYISLRTSLYTTPN